MSSFTLRPAPPFRLDLTAWALRRVPVNEMDRWDGQTYSRALVVKGQPVEVSVAQVGPPDRAELIASSTGPGAISSNSESISSALTKMLGLNIDLTDFYRLAGSYGRLQELAERFAGFKPPRLPSTFEALVNGIACQQISLVAGIRFLNRLCANYGLSVDGHYTFPRPEDLLEASIEDLRKLGFTNRKADYILSLSRSVAGGELDLGELETLDDNSAMSRLCDIRGVGRWTAQYVALRGLGRLNVFPADDVGSQSKLQHWLELDERPDYEGAHRIVDEWSPYRGLLYFLLLLDSQERQGLLSDSTQPAFDHTRGIQTNDVHAGDRAA